MCLHRHPVERWVIFGEHGQVVSGERRSYQNYRYLLLKAKRIAVINLEFIAVANMKKGE